MRYISNTDFICTYHRIISENTKKILKIMSKENTVENNEIEDMLNEILLCAKLATKSGKKMESRLYQYHNAVESLGFKRKPRKNELKNDTQKITK